MPKLKAARVQPPADSPFGFTKPVFQPHTAALPMAPVIQAKLKVGEPDDKFEQEVDRVAELRGNDNGSIPPSAEAESRSPMGSLQRLYGNQPVLQTRHGFGGLPAPSVPLRPSQGGILQRKCACGGAPGMSGECEECSKKQRLGLQTKLTINEPGDIYEQEADRIADQVMATPAYHAVSGAPPRIQRFVGQPAGHMDAAPASVDQALARPGRPLEPALRQDMEQRFGHDFSRVRVHSGAAAEQSARDVNAQAYTVGHDIVFGAGRFAPGTNEDRRLLAHELTHVVQQNQGAHQLQRLANCNPARLSLEDCPPRQPGEAQRAHSGAMVFLPSLKDPITGDEGVLIANFDIGSAAIKRNLHETIYWKQFLKKIAADRSQWKLLGFTDCQGAENPNQKLREDRAAAVFKVLPKEVQSQITSHEGAPIYRCITENNNAADRTLNRSVAILITGVRREMDFELIEIEGTRPEPKTEEPDTEGCNTSQRDALARAFPLAKEMVRAAIGAIDDESLMKQYFGDDALAHRNHIKQNLVEIWDGLKWGPTFECNEGDSWYCDEAHARVIPIVGLNIHICPSAIALGDDFLARTIVHECAHGFAFVFIPDELCAGGWPSSKDTTDAEDNADCYGEFAGDALAQSP